MQHFSIYLKGNYHSIKWGHSFENNIFPKVWIFIHSQIFIVWPVASIFKILSLPSPHLFTLLSNYSSNYDQHTVNRHETWSQPLGTSNICGDTWIITNIFFLYVGDKQPRGRYSESPTIRYNTRVILPSNIWCRHATCRAFKTNVSAYGSIFLNGGPVYAWCDYRKF